MLIGRDFWQFCVGKVGKRNAERSSTVCSYLPLIPYILFSWHCAAWAQTVADACWAVPPPPLIWQSETPAEWASTAARCCSPGWNWKKAGTRARPGASRACNRNRLLQFDAPGQPGGPQLTVSWDTGPDWPPAVRHTLPRARGNTSSCCCCCPRSPRSRSRGCWSRAGWTAPARSPRRGRAGFWTSWGSWPTPAAISADGGRGAASRPSPPGTLSRGTPLRRRHTAVGRRRRPFLAACRSSTKETRFASPCTTAVPLDSLGKTWGTLQ